MNKMRNLLASRTKPVFAAYLIFLVGIITSIVFLITDGADRTFSMGCFLCVVIGSVVGLADILIHLRGMLIFAAALSYVAGVGFHLYAALPSLSDLWNHVNFIGGNQSAALVFGTIYIVLTAGLIVINFFSLSKPQEKKA